MSPVDVTKITEYVKHSWYADTGTNLNPSAGVTVPASTKAGAYSWIKAPRYGDTVHEVGPLARMWVNGDYRQGIGVLDRLVARALEAKKVADAMDGWLNQLVPGAPVYTQNTLPATADGIGLTEAPRGALGHWVHIASVQDRPLPDRHADGVERLPARRHRSRGAPSSRPSSARLWRT